MTVSLGKIKELGKNKTVRVILLLAAALLLLLLVYRVFFAKEKTQEYSPTALEQRLIVLLTEIEGVRSAKVMVTEENGTAVSAVIVYSGSDDFLTRFRLIDVATTALGLGQNAVAVYAA